MRTVLALAAVALALSACTSSPTKPVSDSTPSPSTPTATESTPPPDPGPRPKVGECHLLSFNQAVSVVGRTEPVACKRRHTAETYFVGRLRLATKAGHVRRVDSRAAQRQARTTCTARLPRHLGRTPRELRLTLAQAVWFTPSPARAEAVADRMEGPCGDAARARAGDPLDFTWSQESPSREQWAAGQRYGICWVPA